MRIGFVQKISALYAFRSIPADFPEKEFNLGIGRVEICPENRQESMFLAYRGFPIRPKEAAWQSQQFARRLPRLGEVGILHHDEKPGRMDGQRVRHLRLRNTLQGGFHRA